jgi:hypothetical protein
MMNQEDRQEWQPITLTESERRELIRQALKGTITRKDFQRLWPEDVLLIKIIYPTEWFEEQKRNENKIQQTAGD